MKYSDAHFKRKAAAQYHQDYAAVNVAKALEITQRQRGDFFSAQEYAEMEAAALLAVYFVHLDVTGMVRDEELQSRLLERARKIASEKLGMPLDAETVEVPK